MQWGQLVTRKSTTTTLPVKLDSLVCLPDGSVIVSSGDLRGTGAVADAGQTPRARRTTKGPIARLDILLSPGGGCLLDGSTWLAAPLRLFPLLRNPHYLGLCRSSSVFRSGLPLYDAREHPLDDERVKGLHCHRRRQSGKAHVWCPVQGVFEPGVLVGGVGLGVVFEPPDQVRHRVLVSRKIAPLALLEDAFKIVNQVHQELSGAFLVLCKLPYNRAARHQRQRHHASGPKQRRPDHHVLRILWLFFFGPAQQAQAT